MVYQRKPARQDLDAPICSGNRRPCVGIPEGKKINLFFSLCFSHILGFLYKPFPYVALKM